MDMLKILIIKLGALGDVVRTLCILPAIKEKYPDSEIFWVTKENALELFENNPHISKVFSIPYISKEKFDILYNFDVEEEATKLAKETEADKKYGFYTEAGYPTTFNISAEYYLNTIFDDELKKKNRKTYQEMMFEVAELPWKKQTYSIYLSEKDKKYASDFIKKNKIKTENLIGIHMGAGKRWPSKAWHEDRIKEFIIKAKEKGHEILLFAGPEEGIEKQEKIIEDLKQQGIKIYQNNPKNSLKEFASLVNLCPKIICSDSLALHISLALKKKTIALFFCTSPYEVEGYKSLKKIISPILEEFFPEKMDKYDEKLVKSISVEEVFQALENEKSS